MLLIFLTASSFCQSYYLRGEVKDESGNPLQNVILLHIRTGYVYRTGSQGTFGIIADRVTDSFQVSLSGFKEERVLLNGNVFNSVRLKALPLAVATGRRDKLASMTRGLAREEQRKWFAGGETYENLLENGFINAARYPSTGFSPNIDRASYSNIRRFIRSRSIVPPDAVRIEEMLNYFSVGYSPPPEGQLFSMNSLLTGCPWNAEHQLYYINLSARRLDLEKLPPSNLVFLIDVSASMDMPTRLPLLQSSFRMLVDNLRDKDSVAIVVYGGITGIVLNTTSGREKEKIMTVINELEPGGFTPGESGIQLAYHVAKTHFIEGGNNRVILATDGDFNVGLKKESELDELISRYRESGIYLTCLGVGMGNYKDSKIQTLARKGNGNFAYLDNMQEAEKVLMKEFTQTLYSVADDVYMNVSFNTDYVGEYRLIGFDNRMTALSDSLSAVEGGEIGSGHSMLAVFEIVPTEQNRIAVRQMKQEGDIGQFMLRYKAVGDSVFQQQQFSGPFRLTAFDKIDRCYRFATAVTMFGSLLRRSAHTRMLRWDDVISLAIANINPADRAQEEFVELVRKAKEIYTKQKKKKDRR